MGVVTTRVYCCDGPACAARTAVYELTEGWRRVDSCAHLETAATRPARGRRSNTLPKLERMSGSISLHLCPAHADAFDAHTPITDSHPGVRGREASVSVRCSCGFNGGWVANLHRITSSEDPAPRSQPEMVWWRHLPAELQGYSSREAS